MPDQRKCYVFDCKKPAVERVIVVVGFKNNDPEKPIKEVHPYCAEHAKKYGR